MLWRREFNRGERAPSRAFGTPGRVERVAFRFSLSALRSSFPPCGRSRPHAIPPGRDRTNPLPFSRVRSLQIVRILRNLRITIITPLPAKACAAQKWCNSHSRTANSVLSDPALRESRRAEVCEKSRDLIRFRCTKIVQLSRPQPFRPPETSGEISNLQFPARSAVEVEPLWGRDRSWSEAEIPRSLRERNPGLSREERSRS